MKTYPTQEFSFANLIIGIIDSIIILCSTYIALQIIETTEPDYILYFKPKSLMVLALLSYIPAFLYFPPLLYMRMVYIDKIIERIFKVTLLFIFIFTAVLTVFKGDNVPYYFIFLLLTLSWLFLSIERITLRSIIKSIRRKGRNPKKIILVGQPKYLTDLYSQILDPNYGFHIVGIFYIQDIENENEDIIPVPYLGRVERVTDYLRSTPSIEAVYCTISENNQHDTKEIMKYCESSFVRFYAIPVYLNLLKKKMYITQIGDQMVMTARNEPLSHLRNAIIKRTFDIIVSLLFLLTLFPVIYVIAAILIKKQSPGPVIFKQERSGLNGKKFICYKFRSMHMNNDSDKIQATLNDPRKFNFGNFMRKTNIDELPQFINVLAGNMSIVGPRPHMLIHTEEYSKLIQEYLVRHWIKPGITGWAQVLGFRGETQELKQMEDRVKADIWYVENWNFWLDLKIIWKTIWNMISRNDKNAY